SLRLALPSDHYFRHVVEGPLRPCFDFIGSEELNERSVGRALIGFSLASLLLYVPDRPVDPALKPRIERELFRKKQYNLQQDLHSMQRFEEAFTGTMVNLQTQTIDKRLAERGKEPKVPEFARPPVSELNQLQVLFT